MLVVGGRVWMSNVEDHGMWCLGEGAPESRVQSPESRGEAKIEADVSPVGLLGWIGFM